MSLYVFALDGASFDLVDKWIEEGRLPVLKEIKESGRFGPLHSTFPPLTGPAWSSFQTGVNPGKHGIYNWMDTRKTPRGELVNFSSISSDNIWNIISREGGKIGSISVPMTYPPPEDVNGFVIPGFLTPPKGRRKSFPKGLAKELNSKVPGFRYSPRPFIHESSREKWVDHLVKVAGSRGEAARYLFSRFSDGKKKELFVVHFFSTDMVQHFLWPEKDECMEPILRVFKKVDEEIGKVMDRAPDESLFMVMSDHGFGKLDQIFHVNSWLRKEGYLKLKKRWNTKIRNVLAKLGINQHRLKPLGEFLYPIGKKLNVVDENILNLANNNFLNNVFLSPEDVDWSRTLAYSRSNVGHVRLNTAGCKNLGLESKEDRSRLRDEIMEKLRKLRNPRSGKKLASWVKPREEVYHGSQLEGAPEILFNPLREKTLGYGAAMFLSPRGFTSSFRPGHHRKDGILMACGPGIDKGQIEGSIVDVAPTILNSLSVPISRKMDGEVISSISPNIPKFKSGPSNSTSSQKKESNDQVKARLESMGYL